MRLKIEKTQGLGDDTALNQIGIYCSPYGSTSGSWVYTGNGYWGDWWGAKYCPSGHYIDAYQMRSEKSQGGGDDTALNGVKFHCTNGGWYNAGSGYWGDWGSYPSCGSGEAVTRFKSQNEGKLGIWRDDTAMNNF